MAWIVDLCGFRPNPVMDTAKTNDTLRFWLRMVDLGRNLMDVLPATCLLLDLLPAL